MSSSAMPALSMSMETSADAVKLLEAYCVPPCFSRESYAIVSQLDLALQAKAYTTAEYEVTLPWDR